MATPQNARGSGALCALLSSTAGGTKLRGHGISGKDFPIGSVIVEATPNVCEKHKTRDIKDTTVLRSKTALCLFGMSGYAHTASTVRAHADSDLAASREARARFDRVAWDEKMGMQWGWDFH
ncbi:hypothetical protein B0J14DRAFT_555454 [Halenospora varia]|nr:hypothetical protein B0J14DRAFT_555454 [Halenospora varia]